VTTSDLPGSLLTTKLFRTNAGDLTLPGLLAALVKKEPIRLSGVRHHQTYAVHAFLVNIAVLALQKMGAEPSEMVDEARWFSALKDLAPNTSTAWTLLSADPTVCAFLQPALQGHSFDMWKQKRKEVLHTPDEIDIYNPTANHTPKARTMTHAELDCWVYSLITLQTSTAGSSAYHQGASRCGGRGRFYVGLRSGDPTEGLGQWFARDVDLLFSYKSSIQSDYGYAPKGHSLLWTLPWSGTKKEELQPKQLHPLYLDCARLIRLVSTEYGLGALMLPLPRGDAGARVKMSSGLTGDLWMPIQTKGKIEVAFEPKSPGLRYDSIHSILWAEDNRRPKAVEKREDDGPTIDLYLAGLILEPLQKTKTEGFHERTLSIPAKASIYFDSDVKQNELAQRSFGMIEVIGEVEKLLNACIRILQEKTGKAKVSPAADAFDIHVDRNLFFDFLFANLGKEAWLREWVDLMFSEARLHLESLVSTVPLARRWRKEALALNRFTAGEVELRTKKEWVTMTEAKETEDPREEYKKVAEGLSFHVNRLELGERAALRKVDPEVPKVRPALDVLKLVRDALPEDPEEAHQAEAKWLFLASLMAYAPDLGTSYTALGTTLHNLDTSDTRVEKLLRAEGESLRQRIREVVTQIKSKSNVTTPKARINWGELAVLLIAPEPLVKRAKKDIARAFYR
jgi:CRISPR system Cascade subunit CasA